MATNASTTPDAKAQSGGGKSRWILIIAIALVVILGAAAGGYFWLGGHDTIADAEAKAAPPPDPVFVTLDPFTVNLGENDGRVLYVKLALKVEGDHAADDIRQHMPEMRNRLLMTLTSASADQIANAAGKRALAEQLTHAATAPFSAAGDPVPVDDVLFTDFIVQ